MAAFPGATLAGVRDPTVDDYRLPPVIPQAAGPDLPDEMPDFAPPDAEPMDEMELEDEL
jgi:hypothetical protein